MSPAHTHRPPLPALFLFLCLFLPGCIAERSFPMRPERMVSVPNSQGLTTRAWAQRVHEAAAGLLPADRRIALTTGQLALSEDTPVNVWTTFNLHPEQLDTLFYNFHALQQAAQTVSPIPQTIQGHIRRPLWEGFQDVLVPVGTHGKDVFLYGRLGDPDPANEIPGSYIVITHGLFGSLDGLEVINNVQALRKAGHHVLAIEMRGHGETYCIHPEYAISFGLYESSDFLTTARWLKATHGATRVGLVAFSLTGYEALLTAWLDGQNPATEVQKLPFYPLLPTPGTAPAYNAGMFIVSAPINFMQVAHNFDYHFSILQAPIKSTFQGHVARRLDSFQTEGFSMWDLARSEFSRSDFRDLYPNFDAARPDLTTFLDLSAKEWQIGAQRMENVRAPLLILNAANDPLASAQGVADLFARQHNPNVGVVILKEGSHIGFSAFSADYYYSLMTNFFNPQTAPYAIPIK